MPVAGLVTKGAKFRAESRVSIDSEMLNLDLS
jgi:hypothetical protein